MAQEAYQTLAGGGKRSREWLPSLECVFRADKLEAEQAKDVQQGLSDPQKVSASETAVSKDPSETKVPARAL